MVDKIDSLSTGLKIDEFDLEAFKNKISMYVENRLKKGLTLNQAYTTAASRALENLDKHFPDWQYLAGRLYLHSLYYSAAENRKYEGDKEYPPFKELLGTLLEKGIYSDKIVNAYTVEEIEELERFINPLKDLQYSYLSMNLFAERYLAKDYAKNVFELPQERNLIIAMALMMYETQNRNHKVKEMYWALSNRYQTVATPTMKNAGMGGQLSSCYVDTMEDSLEGIYMNNLDVAQLSKWGAGIGVYMGKVRARGSDIRGYLEASSGLLPWMKQLNNTAVSVDQLGQRNGAIAVYTDVWHKDVRMFIDARLNNGDERLRTHDLSLGLCIPDLFMETVNSRGMWYLFDPHEVKKKMGWSLEDFYDEKRGEGTWRNKYAECVANEDLSRVEIPALELMQSILRTQKETGYSFMFYRDEVNRMNPNKHEGMIYSSNLCTEITQNMSVTTIVDQYVVEDDGSQYTMTKRKHGDFVVCNLASINLAKAEEDDVLERLIPITVRGLDNVIDQNEIIVEQARTTTNKYRAIGLGTFGWHHHLALKGIKWESQEAVDECDRLYERIAFLAIKASHELALEKGSYPAFKGSEWNTGEYFVRKAYVIRDAEGVIQPIPGKEYWYDLCKNVMIGGLRNGHIMAVAPNMSTAKIGGSTDGIDPVFNRIYAEEKKDYKIPTTVPDLNEKTWWFYKNGFMIDQEWSIKQNAVRQRHVDQAISFNLYLPDDITASKLLSYHMMAWDSGIKTTYYTRSQSNSKQAKANDDNESYQPDDLSCESCT